MDKAIRKYEKRGTIYVWFQLHGAIKKGKEEKQGERIKQIKGKGKTPGYGPGFILSLFLVHHSFSSSEQYGIHN